MHRTCRTLALALCCGLIGCASSQTGTMEPPTREQREAAARAGFEISPVRHASDLLAPDQLEGPYHQIRDAVLNDGRSNVYWVTSDFGDFEVRGDEQLWVVLREIEVLAAMRATSMTAEFAAAAGRALTSPFVATWNLITNPVDSIVGVPAAAWKTIRRTANLTRSERSEFEDGDLAALIGFEDQKRRIATELEVDPYSSNLALQKELNRFAWAAYAGSLPSMLVPFIDSETDAPPNEDRLSEILREFSPEDLRQLNRIELAVMGIDEPLADQFIGHRWYSPRNLTVLVAALAQMDLTANRVAFIEAAITADSEQDAQMFTHTARLLRAYNDRASWIRAIVRVDGRLMAYADDQTLILPLAADYAVWNPMMANLAGVAERPLPSDQPVSRTALWVTGTVSELARDRLQERGIEITERAFDRLREDAAQ